MAANYALRPKLKANFSNATYMAQYKVIADNLDAAAAALDKKVVSASVDSLKTAVEAVQGAPNPEGSVYWDQGYNFFGYDDFNSVSWNGWKEARNRALNLYNSTIAPEEPVVPEKPGDDATLIEKQKYEKAYAQWETDHAAWETAIAAWQMPTISAIDVAYAEQQIKLWGPRLIKLDAVKTHLDAAIKMCTIDSADASKYDADRWEAYAKSFAYAQKVSTSFNASTTMRTQVREAMNNLIYNWKRLIANPVVTVTFTFTVNGETHAVLTGNQGDTVDLSTIAAPDAPVGMHFVGWGNVPATFDADATFEAQFANNTDTKYTVNVYTMDTTGNYPATPDSTYQGAGETGSTADITADVAPAEGFSLDSAKSVLTGTIAADGSLVLSIYYSRNKYTITYANTDLEPDERYYGAVVNPATPEKAGFKFDGWEEEVPTTMPANNVVLTAKWAEDPANYTDYDIAVDAAKAKKAEANYDKTYTEASRKALDAALAVDVSNKKRSEQGVVDAQTAAINAAVKGLEKMTYNANFYVDNELYHTVATEVGAQIVAPEAPTKEGYTFTGWNPEVGVMGVEDVRFDAKFSAGTVGYKVETYVMGLDGNYGDAAIEDKSATTGETVSVTPETREGFTVADNSVLSGTVEADGSLVLKVYYSRNQYKLTVDGNVTNVYYGSTISVSEPAAREGYTFAGWDRDVPETMPASDVTLVSKWNENDANYTAYNAAKTAAKAKQAEANFDKTYTAESRQALADALAKDVSGRKYTQQSEVDAAAKAINDAVTALELMTYNATFYVDGTEYRVVPTKVGEQIAKPGDPSKTGYVFTGWDPEVGVMGVEDVRFDAKFSAGEVSYTVETYVMGLDGEYGAAETKNVPATTGEEITLTPDAREGFTVAGESVLTGTVAADSSLVLKVYYSRNQYKLSVDGAESDVYFGAALEIADPAPREGYTFTGWSPAVPATMPAEDLTLVPQWSENGADYTAYNKAVSAAKAKQTESDYAARYTKESRNALAAALAADVSGKKYTQQGEVDAATTAINNAVAALELMTYNAIFNIDGVEYAKVSTKVGEQIVAPADPTKEGYTFAGWRPSVGVMGTADATFEAVFTAAGNTAYTVNTYVMGTDGTYGEPTSDTLTGTTGSTATYAPEAREGFTVADESVLSGTIAADGSLVLKVFYSRNQYTLTAEGVAYTFYYGAAVSVADPVKEHYTFAGWDPALPETMPAHDVTVVAKWTEDGADYTAYNAAVAAAQAKKAETDYDKTYTAESRAALDAALAEKVSGKKYSEQNVVDAATKAINDAIAALELMTYTATFYVDGAVRATVQAKVGEQIAKPNDPTKEGYVFTGWNPEVGVMGTEDVSFNAQFTAGAVSYKVETYVMGLDGQYGAAETKTVPATTGAAVSVEPEAREGFTVADNSVLSGVVAADSSLVLKVYYSRNQYKLSVDGVESDVYYGAALNIAAPAAREGFTFTGWNVEVPANMPASDLTLVSQWSENDADYSAYNAAVSAAQAKKGEENYDKTYTAETRAALAGALAIDVAGKKYSEQSVVDAATKAINDAVAALEVMTYNAIFTVDGVQYEVVPTKVGEQIVAPKDPAKEGYVFKGWDKEVGKMGVEDITFAAQFEKASGIAYTVEVYTMDVNGNYGAAETKTLYGTTDATVNADTTAAEGFTFDESAANVVSGTVAADGSLVLKVYFARNQYKLSVDGAESMVYYGAAISVAEPTKENETFNGWDPALPETMPAHDVTVVSTWTKNGADYTAYNEAKAKAEAKQNEENYDKKYTAETRNALAEALKTVVPEGLKYDEQETINAATKAINDAVAGLELMTYTATFYVDGVVHATVQAKVGEQIAKPDDPTKTGYVFTGWNPEVGVMGVEDVRFDAKFSAGEVSYTVETYVMGLDGEYGAAETKNVPATTGEEITLTPDAREGFTVAGESVLTGTVAADSSLVLKVYYSRNQYKLSVDGAESDVYFGAALEIADPAPREGYTFTGWSPAVPATMPAEDLTLVPQWSENGADYTAYNKAVSAAKAKQTESDYAARYTKESRNALAAALAADVSGKKYTQQGEVDAATTAINNAVAALELMTYNAIFNIDGVEYAKVSTKVGEQIVAPADPTKEGYTFAGWRPSVGVMGTADATFEAVFTAAGNTAYTVNTYVMGTDGTYGEPTSDTLTGTTGSTATYAPEAREGFTVADESVLSGTIAADGSLVLKVFYSRNQYTLTAEGVAYTFYYGAAVSVADPVKEHYTFAGWDPALPETMPAHDVTVVAKWTEDGADYTAYNAAVAAAQAKKAETDYDKTYTAESRAALDAALAEKVSGKKYSEQNVVDAATKAINDAIAALELMTYTATFYVDGAVRATVQAKVGEQIAKPNDPTKEGYVFTGWNPEVGVMGTEDVSFNAQFTAGAVSYKVETYVMGLDGQYGAAETKTVPATTGAAVSVEPEAREGFTVADNSVLSGVVAADSSLVLKVYYSRNQYKLSVDGVESDVYYGAALNIAAPAAREGFTFTGWNVEVPANMPASDLTLVSQWSENDADYSAYNAAVSAAQAKKGEENYDKTYTAETRAALAGALAIDVAGKKYSEQSVVDAATKAINDAVAALEVMTYNAIFTVDGVQYEVVPTKVGEQIVAPKDPAKEGYVFKGWDKEVGKMGVEDITFAAQFEKASGIAYTVEVYTMDVNGNYGAAETKTLYGTTDATVNADTTAAEGFTFDESAANVVSGTVAADGSLVLKVYFARNQYKLSVDGAESMVYYGAAISVAEPTKENETFNGWDPALPETMPAHDVTVVSTWTKNGADYTAYNEAKAKAEAKQNEENYDKKYTAETRNALAEALKTVVPEGLKYDEQETINAATTAINDAVKALELMTYTATFYVNGEVHATVTAKVGEQIAAPADPIVDGYNFTGWDPEVGTMGIENVRFDAILVANGSSIISVTPATPNYGGMHQYAVKVKGEPQKLRIVDAYGTTRTFDRNTSMTSDVNAFGILKIEKTEDGEIWTLNVNLVEGEYTALAKFDKAWEEDGYDFTVKFDTKPSEPVSDGVLDVTYNTPNYGGKQEYFVKVSGKADKIQIAYENGGTTTRARYDLRVSIKSYDAQGNEVDAKSANLAYEIWTVKLNIAEGKHVARAKYGKVWTGDHEFTVVYDVKPAPKGVVDVTYDTPNYGGKQQYSFKVDGKASKIQIAYGEGGTTTFIRIDPRVSIKSYDAQGNEVSANSADLAYEIWTVKLSIPEGKHLAKAKYGKTWTDGFEFDVVITSKPIKVVSVTAVSVSADSVAVTVNGTAKKVRITYASGATRTYDRDDIGVSIASNGDGEIWTINVKLTEGDYTATAKYMANGKQVWDTTDFAFTV